MVEKLPISDFIWRSLTKQQIEEYDAAGDTGYFVECDLTIPNELHDKFNCFPIAAEPLEITEKIASPKSLEILKGRTQNELPTGSKRKLPFPDDQKVKKFSCVKLAPNPFSKEKVYLSYPESTVVYTGRSSARGYIQSSAIQAGKLIIYNS